MGTLRMAWLEDLGRDLRYAVHALRNAPGFAAVSIATLGVGLGAATAVFSVVNAVLLRPLPYPEAERIVWVRQVNAEGRPAANISGPNFQDLRERSRSFDALAIYEGGTPMSVLADGRPHRANVLFVSEQFLDVLGVRPVVGRGFLEEEARPGGAPAAIVSHAYWQRWFGGDPDLSGKALRVGPSSYPVVGVLPPEFDYPAGVEVLVPLSHDPATESRTAHNYRAIGRLAAGVGLDRARAELSRVARELKERYGSETMMSDATATRLQDVVTGGVRRPLLILFGAAALLLLIACANVSNLLLARTTSRERELAVRLALGAGRGRIVRQIAAESLVLCAAGGVLGVLIAHGGVAALLAFEPGNLPRAREIDVSWAALSFAMGAVLVCTLVLAALTSLRAAGREIHGALMEAQRTLASGRRGQRVRNGLVIVQIATTLVLLAGAALLARSFARVLAVDPGYRTERALILDVALPAITDWDEGRRQAAFREELMARLRSLPGVVEVGSTSALPLGNAGFYPDGLFIEMNGPDEIQSLEDFQRLDLTDRERVGAAGFRVVSAGYFRAMGIPLLRGRLFDEGDVYDAPHVAVISESLARTKWPGEDPIGRYIQFGNMDGDLRPFRIVGIVGDVREVSLESRPEPLFYVDHRQRPRQASQTSIVVYGTEDAAVASAAERIVRDLDPEVPVRVRRLSEVVDASLAGRRFSLLLLGLFSAAALLVATMGIYGVVSYLVAQRTHEIGIRMALGAGSREVMRLVIGRGAALAVTGTLIGLASALALTRVLSSMLYGVSATDPVTFVAVALIIAAAALLASYLPARQAARLPPAATLRMG
jgi:putative ABC transport system permease protein